MRVMWAPAVLLLPVWTFASDWKYAGYSDPSSTGPSVSFYDSDSVARAGSTVRYWLKSIPQATLDGLAGPEGSESFNQCVEDTAVKIARGYVPPLLAVPAVRDSLQGDFKDLVLQVAWWETAVNKGATPSSRFLFEVDCSEKRMRILDGAVFDKKGNQKPSSGTFRQEWRYYPARHECGLAGRAAVPEEVKPVAHAHSA